MKKKLLVFAALLVLALAVAGIASAIEVENGQVVAEGDLDAITAVGGHPKPADWDEYTSGDCTEYGRAAFICNVGDTTHTHWVKIAPSGHLWSSTTGEKAWGRVVEEPTCTSEGYAIDVCLRWGCGAENPDVTRTIEKRPHEYDEKHYDVVKEPGCGEDGNGLGWKTCIYCGVRHPDTTGATDGTAGQHLVILDKIKHNWSDWRVGRDSDCGWYGWASRTCIRCGAVQHLSEGSPVMDQGKEIKIGDVLPLKNEAWNVNGDKLDGLTFEKRSELEKALTSLKFEYEVKRDLLANCGCREITFTCPYCHGDIHNDFKVYLTEKAHDWKAERDPYVSVPAWCTTDGYDIFFCKYDPEKHSHTEAFDKDPEDVTFEDGFKKVITKAVGHDWGEWTVSEVYEKDGKKYGVYFRSCKRCLATEQKTEEVKKPGTQGLAQDDEGRWAYFVDGVISADTLLVPFQGGEFWVVNGYVANASGLTICPDGKAYFLVYGQVARVSQWAEYNGEWFIIENGLLNPVTGLRVYGGSTFAVQDGQMMKNLDGLFGDPETGKIAYCKGGMVQTGFSGTVEYDGETYTVVNGYVVR